MRIVFCFLSCALVAVTTADFCSSYFSACTSMGISQFYKRRFASACLRHNACFVCGSLYGYNKSVCDDEFLLNLLNSCSPNSRHRDNGLDRSKMSMTCSDVARMFHKAYAGVSKFDDYPPSHCSSSLVRYNCLPRTTL